MKRSFTALLAVLTVFLYTCSSTGSARGTGSGLDGAGITARGALGRLEAAFSGPLYSGDGGAEIKLAILAPEVQGSIPDYLPLYIQGLLNNNFNSFSAVSLIDRQNLNQILGEQNIAISGNYSDNDLVRIGNLTNARFFLFGSIQRLSGSRVSLQLSITEASTGVRRATTVKDGILAELEGRATLINAATAELLAQLGVQLTESGRQLLLAGNTSTTLAEAGLARGIIAQAGGEEVAALFNFAQAVSFDPGQLEAISRLSTLSATIGGGTITQQIMNDVQARDRWLEAFRETARFFDSHPPFEITFDPSLIQIGETDYARRTATLGMRIALDPSEAGFSALNALLEGLEETGRRDLWGFSGWPFVMGSTREMNGTKLFGGKQSFRYKIDVTLVNENSMTIGTGNITINTESIRFTTGDKNVMQPSAILEVVNFPRVKVDNLTPTLTIVIVAMNGIRSRDLSSSGYMRIETGDLDERFEEHLAELARLEQVRRLENQRLEYERNIGQVNSVAFSPDGKQIVSGSNSNNIIRLWDAATGRLIKTFSGDTSYVMSVAFSPDGKQIVSGSVDMTIKLWDVTTGDLIRTLSGHTSTVRSAVFSPDGRQIVSGSDDNTCKLWDANTGNIIRTFTGHTDTVHSVAFSPDGRQIVSGSSDKTIRHWDVGTGNLIRTYGHTGQVYSAKFSPDGSQIVSGSWNSTIRLWDANTGNLIRTFTGHTDMVISVAFSPDGRQIVSGSYDKTIKLWNVGTGNLIRTFTGRANWLLQSVAFRPDGSQIVSGSWDKPPIRLWDVATGTQIRQMGTAR